MHGAKGKMSNTDPIFKILAPCPSWAFCIVYLKHCIKLLLLLIPEVFSGPTKASPKAWPPQRHIPPPSADPHTQALSPKDFVKLKTFPPKACKIQSLNFESSLLRTKSYLMLLQGPEPQ